MAEKAEKKDATAEKGGDKGGESWRKRPAVTALPSGRQALNIAPSSVD